jgi:O-antigen/teichoic acid export membrane protein
MASLSFFGLLNGFSGFSVLQIDRLMVNSFLNSAATGIYSTTFQFGILITLSSRGLTKIATAIISDSFLNRDLKKIDEIYSKSCINQFIVGLFVFLVIWTNETLIFHILPYEYKIGKWVIFIIGLGQLIKMAGGTNDIVIMYSKHYRWVSIFLVLFLFFIILFNYILIPVYGLTGAALASLIAISFHQIMKFAFLKVIYNFQPYNRKFLYAIITAFFSYMMAMIISSPFNIFYVDSVIKTIVASVLYLSIIYFSKLSPDINKAIINFYSRFK